MLTPSEIACKGLDLTPDESIVSETDRVCAACGTSIPAGAGHGEWKPGASFSDWQYLEDGGTAVCRHCKPLLAKTAMAKVGNAVISKNGGWKLNKDTHVTWLLTDPPAPPFVATFKSTMQSQHVIWRSAVTQDRDLILLQFGQVTLSVDRPLLLQAVEWAREVADWAREQGIKVTPHHPFAGLNRRRDDLTHATIRHDILAASAGNPRVYDLIERLLALGEGELWGLSILAKAKPADPEAESLSN